MQKLKFLAIISFILVCGFSIVGFVSNNAAFVRLNAITGQIPDNWWETRWDKRSELEEFIVTTTEEPELCAKAQYLIAGSYYSNKNYPQAILEYNRLLSTYPDEKDECAKAAFEIGQVTFYHINDIPAARDYYRKAISDYPDSHVCPTAQLMIARCFRREGDIAQAMVEYEKLIKDYPKSTFQITNAYRDMAELSIQETFDLKDEPKKEKYSQALSYLKKAYQICPMDEDGDQMAFVLTDICNALIRTDGSINRAAAFMKFQKYGSAGPDGASATPDDLTDVLAQY